MASGAICVPPLWFKSSEAWLREPEAQFALAGVTSDATPFDHALVQLDRENVGLLFDVLEQSSYEILKKRLIRYVSVSETAKLNHLLTKLKPDRQSALLGI